METSAQGYRCHEVHHEPMEKKGDCSSVSPGSHRYKYLKATSAVKFLRIGVQRTDINPEIEEEAIDDITIHFGLNPRLCIEGFTNPERLDRHAHEVERAVSNFNIKQLEAMFRDAGGLTIMDSTSGKILLMTCAKDFHRGAAVVRRFRLENNCLN